MSTTVCVKAFVQFIFILVMILNITVATSWDSLILILAAWKRTKCCWNKKWICQISCDFFDYHKISFYFQTVYTVLHGTESISHLGTKIFGILPNEKPFNTHSLQKCH